MHLTPLMHRLWLYHHLVSSMIFPLLSLGMFFLPSSHLWKTGFGAFSNATNTLATRSRVFSPDASSSAFVHKALLHLLLQLSA
jgi:hypothetical protein